MRQSRVIGAVTGGFLAIGLVAAPALADPQTVGTRPETFTRPVVAVKPGDTVTFVNTDPSDHNVAWDDNGLPPEPAEAQTVWNQPVSRTFTTPGTYRYYCVLHGAPGGHGMAGVVIVNATGTIPPPPKVTGTTATVAAGIATIRFSSTAPGHGSGTVLKRNARGVYGRFGSAAFAVRSGVNRVRVKGPSGRRLGAGAYRLDFTVTDGAGKRSLKRSASFKVK